MGLREDITRQEVAALMPHRRGAGDDLLDVGLESNFGQLLFEGLIDRAEYEAGLRAANIVLRYLQSIDAPDPYGVNDLGPLSDDECFHRKIAMSSVQSILMECGRRCATAFYRSAVYDEPLRGEVEIEALRRGLRALCGI